MIAIQKMIGSKSLLAVCILPLCLAVPAQHTAASPANPAARMSSIIDPPEFPLPPPPPPVYSANPAARMSSIIDPPEFPLPPPPPPVYQGTTAMEQTA